MTLWCGRILKPLSVLVCSNVFPINVHQSKTLCATVACLSPITALANHKGVIQGYLARELNQSFLGLLLVFGCQLWYKLHRSLGSCVVCNTLGVTRLRIVAPRAYHIRQSFLGVYLSRIPRFGIPTEACEKVAVG